MTASSFLITNLAVSVLLHTVLYWNWNLRLAVLATAFIWVVKSASIRAQKNIEDESRSLSRIIWLFYFIFAVVIMNGTTADIDCVKEPTSIWHVLLMLSITLYGTFASEDQVLAMSWPILIVLLYSPQVVYYYDSAAYCYNYKLSLLNDMFYWIAVSMFGFVNSERTDSINDVQRRQVAITTPILVSLHPLFSIVCLAPSFTIWVRTITSDFCKHNFGSGIIKNSKKPDDFNP